MADDRHYVPGDFYRICERTGFKVRASDTRKEWNGRIVRTQSFEQRQPQDFVRGRVDHQTVPDPRPRQANQFITPVSTLPNLIASFDDQANAWPGATTGPVYNQGTPPYATLSVAGVGATAIYEIASANVVDAGAVQNLNVNVNLSCVGLPHNPGGVAGPLDLFQIQNLFGIPDLFNPNYGAGTVNISFLPLVWTAFVWARVEIALAAVSGQWGSWQKIGVGPYLARYVKFRVVFASNDLATDCYLTAFNWQVGIAS